MFENLFKKITQLSQLPAFSGGSTEHALFVILLIVFVTACAITIIFTFKYAAQTIQAIWSRLWGAYEATLKAKVDREQEFTKQIQSKGKTSRSQ